MKQTKILHPSKQHLLLIRQQILQGNIVAIPTETVYGLAANAYDETAITGIFQAKGRPQDNPLIVHVCSMEMLQDVVSQLPSVAMTLAQAFWPGPLTMILPKGNRIPLCVTGGLDTVGVRMPSHPDALAVIETCGVPLAAPSANLSGRPSPTTAQHVKQDLEGRLAYILDGGSCQVGVESTVVSVADNHVTILRPGSVTQEDLARVVPQVSMHDDVWRHLNDSETAVSPGMKYRHYAPKASMTMVCGGVLDFWCYASVHATEQTGVLVMKQQRPLFGARCFCYGDRNHPSSQANGLFAAMRQIDEAPDVKQVLVHAPSKRGIGLAVYNRLLRASAFSVVDAGNTCVIGLTGQTGAGKSTLCAHLSKQSDVTVIDCDKLAHLVIQRADICEKLTAYFGAEILTPEGNLDRKALGHIVFQHDKKREFLTDLMYPEVRRQIQAQLLQQREQGAQLIILDAPTLLESGADMLCDAVISVMAPAHLRKQRIIHRDALSQEAAEHRMSAQPDDVFYMQQSDAVLRNENDLSGLLDQANAAIKRIKEMRHGCEKT